LSEQHIIPDPDPDNIFLMQSVMGVVMPPMKPWNPPVEFYVDIRVIMGRDEDEHQRAIKELMGPIIATCTGLGVPSPDSPENPWKVHFAETALGVVRHLAQVTMGQTCATVRSSGASICAVAELIGTKERAFTCVVMLPDDDAKELHGIVEQFIASKGLKREPF
jgi:hypothetical protein